MYEEQAVEAVRDEVNLTKLYQWREEQKPHVRSFVEEMKKRIELKEDARREPVDKGKVIDEIDDIAIG